MVYPKVYAALIRFLLLFHRLLGLPLSGCMEQEQLEQLEQRPYPSSIGQAPDSAVCHSASDIHGCAMADSESL